MHRNSKLKDAVFKLGRHQYEVAREVGISETRLSRLVQGRAEPTVGERTRLAKVLGVDETDLFEGAAA